LWEENAKIYFDNNNLNTTESIVNFTFGVYHLARVCFFPLSFIAEKGEESMEKKNSFLFDLTGNIARPF
jgi:hypothetical protein